MDFDALTITKYAGAVGVYGAMGMPGDYNDWNPAATLMNPMSSVVENHDWVKKDVTYGADTDVKFAADGSWAANWGSVLFPVGVGTQGGDNIHVAAGTYDIIFNDIMGNYYFIAK